MWFEIDASGIKIKLQIKGVKQVSSDSWDSEWCHCDYLFSSGSWHTQRCGKSPRHGRALLGRF